MRSFGNVMGNRRDALAMREQYAGDPSRAHEKVSALTLLQHPWPVSLRDLELTASSQRIL